MKSWDELTPLEQLQSEYSDYYKSVHNIRPRHISTEQWNSLEWLTEAMKSLEKEAEIIWAEEAECQKQNIAIFEESVRKSMNELNEDRSVIIRQMFETGGYNGDWDYFCFNLNIPYGYFKEFELS